MGSELRLQVYLARSGVASRRASERLISEGRIRVNGVIVTDMGFKVQESDSVAFDDQLVEPETAKRYLLLNKPSGYLSSMSDPEGRPLAYDLIKDAVEERVYNVGRLDFYSSGLLIFSNDGEFARIVSHPSSEIEKEYLVESSLPIPDEALTAFKRGVVIEGIRYKASSIARKDATSVCVELIEGKNREIRRVLAHFNVFPKTLRRVRIGSITIQGLAEGEYRELTPQEISQLIECGGAKP